MVERFQPGVIFCTRSIEVTPFRKGQVEIRRLKSKSPNVVMLLGPAPVPDDVPEKAEQQLVAYVGAVLMQLGWKPMGLEDLPPPPELGDWHPPRILPAGWHAHAENNETGGMYFSENGLKVQLSCTNYGKDNHRWVHLSVSREDRIPDYDDLTYVKDIFIGPSRKAIQVMAPAEEHYNVNIHVLHLWHCLDDDPIPDFRILGHV